MARTAELKPTISVLTPSAQWAYLNGVELGFIRPGEPTDNALFESFHRTFRQRRLNGNFSLLVE